MTWKSSARRRPQRVAPPQQVGDLVLHLGRRPSALARLEAGRRICCAVVAAEELARGRERDQDEVVRFGAEDLPALLHDADHRERQCADVDLLAHRLVPEPQAPRRPSAPITATAPRALVEVGEEPAALDPCVRHLRHESASTPSSERHRGLVAAPAPARCRKVIGVNATIPGTWSRIASPSS